MHTLLEMLYVSSPCGSRTVSRFYQLQLSSPPCNQQPPAPRQTSSPREDHLVHCGLYAFLISFACITPCLCSRRSGLLVQLKSTDCGLEPLVTSHCRSYYLLRHPDVRYSQSVFHQMSETKASLSHSCTDIIVRMRVILGQAWGRGADVWCLLDGYQCFRKNVYSGNTHTGLPAMTCQKAVFCILP